MLSEEEKASIKHLENFMKRIRMEKYPPEAEIALDTSIECILDLIEKGVNYGKKNSSNKKRQ